MSPCCGALTDYQYATWHRCRRCGRWAEVEAPAAKASTVPMVPPLSFNVYPSRAHVSGLPVRRLDVEPQVPPL